jgi:hypothetical protein
MVAAQSRSIGLRSICRPGAFEVALVEHHLAASLGKRGRHCPKHCVARRRWQRRAAVIVVRCRRRADVGTEIEADIGSGPRPAGWHPIPAL